MKNLIVAALALTAFGLPGVASADTARDRQAAISLCRADIAAQANVDPASIELDNIRVRAGLIRVDFDLWHNGSLQNIRCEVSRGAELTVASITPTLTASAR
jgi:hypothetical protein